MSHEPQVLSSLQNARIKHVIELRERRTRDQSKQFIIEGYREILRAFEGNSKIDSFFYCPELFLGENENALIQSIADKGAQLFVCSENVFRKMSYRDRPDGLIAIASQERQGLDHLKNLLKNKNHSPFLVVAEAIEKPGNLGTILRSSDAVHLDALIVCDKCTDIYNPNVVRASVGTLFTVPVIESGGEETILWLKKQNISIVAATPSADLEYTKADLTKPIAIAVGTEQLGLSDRWMQQADIQVKIPMLGVADSLNVAMATTLLLYEALRQRRG
jgi:TrmH family RNA methyltransferase